MTSTSSGCDDASKSVYHLGWGMQACTDPGNHMPPPSLIAFLLLLSRLVSHILSEFNQDVGFSHPPFEMTPSSIDSVNVTKLLDSDTASWSSVVYCIAVNLHWLSQLPVRMPCIL